MDDSFKLKWVECKSQINYDSFREGKYGISNYYTISKAVILVALFLVSLTHENPERRKISCGAHSVVCQNQ